MTRDRAVGVLTLGRLLDWNRWVDRRIESIALEGPLRFRRRVSLDFTYPVRPAPEYTAAGEPVFLAPLTFLRKRPLNDFDLRDESNTVMPLLTRSENARVAASVLAAYAEWRADTQWGGHFRHLPLPAELFETFRALAQQEHHAALSTWENLVPTVNTNGDAQSSDVSPDAWRARLVTDPYFMALARDLAINFLVLTPLIGRVGERRVLKFSYEEVSEPPPTRRQLRVARKRRREAARQTERVASEGAPQGQLIVSAAVDGEPEEDVQISVLRTAGGVPFEKRTRTDTAGDTALQLPIGTYKVKPIMPAGLMQERPGASEVTVVEGELARVEFEFVRLVALDPQPEDRDVNDAPDLRQRIAMAVGARSKRFVVLTPSVGQGGSYHVEAEAPEGLFMSRAELTEEPSSLLARESTSRSEVERRGVEHVHLWLSNAPQDASGVLTLNLRARPWTIIRPACLSALFTTIVLVALARRSGAIGNNAGAVSALLLVVPGGLAAYVARAREHPVTTELLFGLRLMAFASALWSFIAAAILVLNRKYAADSRGVTTIGDAWDKTELALWGLAFLSALTLSALVIAWWRAVNPPECKEG